VGINAVQGSVHRGAKNIIAVDPIPFKLEKSLEFGATHTARDYVAAKVLVDGLTNGQGADRVIVTVGVAYGNLLNPAQEMTRRGGVIVLTSAAPVQQRDVEFDLFTFAMSGKRLQGTLYGSTTPRTDIPLLVDMYLNGKLKLDELITRTYSLSEINQAFQDMKNGKNLRGVIIYD
jgi:Zn-dependent alcohol dehydrogenase